MAINKLRMGIIGANIHRGWAPRFHLPAILASPEFELTAVCTTRKESAEESANRSWSVWPSGAPREMLAQPDVDAVAVVLQVVGLSDDA